MQVFLSRHLFTLIQGMTLGGWRELLRENQYQVDAPYLPRAMFVTIAALTNSAQAGIEQAICGRRVDATQVEPPLLSRATTAAARPISITYWPWIIDSHIRMHIRQSTRTHSSPPSALSRLWPVF
jgi:hypothetical protein